MSDIPEFVEIIILGLGKFLVRYDVVVMITIKGDN